MSTPDHPIPKLYQAPSVFQPEHLLREARRQKSLHLAEIPDLCVLDPDGDLVRHLRATGQARPGPGWACYHTDLVEFTLPDGTTAGVVGCAVGASFAVLVAEQLFASGCRYLLSITSAGRIADLGEPPSVSPQASHSSLILIDQAIRDEGTSIHYLPPQPGPFLQAPNPALLDSIEHALQDAFPPQTGVALHRGPTWTTDAPYRETEAAIAQATQLGALAVEMEAAALYALATARNFPIVCLAHVTNTMGQQAGEDFEKGEAGGSITALRIIAAAAKAFRNHHAAPPDDAAPDAAPEKVSA